MAKSKRHLGFEALVEENFKDKVRVKTSKGGAKNVSRLEVMVLQQVLQAVKGEKKALKFVLEHLAELPAPRSKSKPFIEYRNPDGSREIHYSRGRTKHIDPQGNVTWVHDKNYYRGPEEA